MPDLLLSAARRRQSFIERVILKPHALTYPQFLALEASYLAGGSISIGDVADYCECSRGNMTGVVDRLFLDHLINRTESPQDRRVKELRLTDKGIQLIEQVMDDVYKHPKLAIPLPVQTLLVNLLPNEAE